MVGGLVSNMIVRNDLKNRSETDSLSLNISTMSEPWKCCKNCQCPCKNNDLCSDTPAHTLSKIKESTPERDIRQSDPNSPTAASSPSSSSGPAMDDLLELERKIEERLKNVSKQSDQSLHNSDAYSTTSSLSRHSSDTSIGPTDNELYMNEIHILRLKLQEAELRNAIIEERVNQLEQFHNQSQLNQSTNRSLTADRINQIKRQIIEFIELKFSQLNRDLNK